MQHRQEMTQSHYGRADDHLPNSDDTFRRLPSWYRTIHKAQIVLIVQYL